jgi:hypothetical protein
VIKVRWMDIRRLVLGTVGGKSVVLSDGPVPRSHDYEHVPGFSTALAWSTLPGRSAEVADPITATTSYVPGPGETRLVIASFPPNSVFGSEEFDPIAAYGEQQEHLTGLIDHFDPDHPGMHTTPTIDYGIVLEGKISLELDDGVLTELDTHSIIIQQGNVHAWRNATDKPAKIAFILVGTNPT